jgi:hypothetical protein
MEPQSKPTPTYWYHPESSCHWMHDPAKDEPLDGTIGDGMSVEITEYQYVDAIIKAIDADPEHKLPEGVTAVIKNAYTWPGNKISGEIWYDSHGRFSNGHQITSAVIEKIEPGGIFCTKNNKYLVHIIEPRRDSEALRG